MAAPKKSKILELTPVDENTPLPKKSLLDFQKSVNKNSKWSTNGRGSMASKLSLPQVIPTGILQLDYDLKIGGFPRGKVIQIYGDAGSYKSTLCYRVVAETQKLGGEALWLDAENSFNPLAAKACGVDLEHCYVYMFLIFMSFLLIIEHRAILLSSIKIIMKKITLEVMVESQ